MRDFEFVYEVILHIRKDKSSNSGKVIIALGFF